MLIKSNYIVGSESLKQKKTSLQQRMLSLYLLSCYRQKNPLKQKDKLTMILRIKNKERTYNGKNIDKEETIDNNTNDTDR